MRRQFVFVGLALLFAGRLGANEISHASLRAYPNAIIAVKDKATGVTAYVESDGRHLVLLSKDGQLLEVIAVIKGKLECVGTPVIRHLVFRKDKLSVTFCKHDYGEVDLKLNQYRYLGSD